MKIELRWIGNKYVEVKTDEIGSGLLDKGEALVLAKHFLGVTEELLIMAGKNAASCACYDILDALSSKEKEREDK